MKFKVGCKLCENDKGVRDLTSLVNKLLKYANKSIDNFNKRKENRIRLTTIHKEARGG